MHIRNVTISIILYGQNISISFLAKVRRNSLVNVFYPIGKELKYVINGEKYLIYQPLSIIIYHSNHNIEIFEEKKFVDTLKHLLDKCNELQIKTYRDKGIKIESISQYPLINNDPRVTTLENNKVPKQSKIRVLIDITDQVADTNPSADINIVFYTKGKYTTNYGNKPTPFYIDSISAQMQFNYDGKFVNVYNSDIGYFKYNTKTGRIIHILSDKLKQILYYSFKQNYSDVEKIEIYILAIEINVNYRSIIFN
jgi:hypothetical protein